MRARVPQFLTAGLVPRATTLGLLASLMAIAPLGVSTPAAQAATGTITEFNNAKRPGIIQNSSSDPLGLTVGPDGNLWFTDAGENLQATGGAAAPPKQIGRFHVADGSLSFNPAIDWFPNGEPGSVPVAIANSGDNNLWFANFGTAANDVGAINSQGGNPLGAANPFGVGVLASTITDITLGPDNNMWFTMFGSGNIGHIGRDGSNFTALKLPGGRSAAQPVTTTVTQNPQAITAGPDGNLWFTIQQSKTIGRMTPGGTFTEFTPPTTLHGLAGITAGSDGNLYVTAEGDSTANPSQPNRPVMSGNGSLARVTPSGVIVPIPAPAGASRFSPNAIVNGPDGNLWFTDVGGDTVWRFNPLTAAFTPFPVPTPSAFSGNVQPTGITVGPDGNIWFTENNAVGGLARLTIDPLVQLSPSPAGFGTHLPGSTTNVAVVASNTTSNAYTITSAPTITGPNAGDFTVVGNNCNATSPLGPLASCTMTIRFKPTGTGTRSATLTLGVNDNATPHTALLTGVGQAAVPTFGPASAAFGNSFVHQVTRPVNFSLTNVTGVPVKVNSVTLGQPHPNDFIIGSDTCTGATVPDSSSCTVSVSFAPTTVGPRSSSLTVVANGAALPSSILSGTGVAAPPGSNPGNGYWEVASDGGIFNFGSATFLGSTGSIKLNKPIVGMARTADGNGYWLVATDGGIFAFGNAKFFGSTGSIHLNQPIVGMAATPDGQGYWLVASDGGIFAFGNAKFFGSTGSVHLNKPIVGMVAAPDGGGYWMVATDGGIFAFGTSKFLGSTGSIHLNQPIVGMASTPDGQGYWLAATDGGIFAFGTSKFFGSTGSIHLNQPVVGIAATLDGAGYWMSATDGGIFNFGDARFFGSTGSIKLNKPMVGLAPAT
ncbi:MAG: hypothetical protein QOD49_1597 [Actinomycetota bacterium]|nr:hypothetical protein [Actinomycetota bacterium]